MVGFNATALHPDTVRIAFGSCADADQPDHPIWNALYQAQPDALLMIGDNVYADSPEFRSSPSREGLETEYAKLEATPAFQRLRDVVPIYATWDDHDYGLNDGGKEFTLKDVSQQVFLIFGASRQIGPSVRLLEFMRNGGSAKKDCEYRFYYWTRVTSAPR